MTWEAVTTKDAVIVAGIGLDKLAKRERWGQEPEGDKYPERTLGRRIVIEDRGDFPSPARCNRSRTAGHRH